MEIKKNGNIISLIGRLDTNTAGMLEEEIGKVTEASVELDLAKLDYISSAGLRVLLMANKQFGENLIIKNVGEDIMEILEMTGFADILNIK